MDEEEEEYEEIRVAENDDDNPYMDLLRNGVAVLKVHKPSGELYIPHNGAFRRVNNSPLKEAILEFAKNFYDAPPSREERH